MYKTYPIRYPQLCSLDQSISSPSLHKDCYKILEASNGLGITLISTVLSTAMGDIPGLVRA